MRRHKYNSTYSDRALVCRGIVVRNPRMLRGLLALWWHLEVGLRNFGVN